MFVNRLTLHISCHFESTEDSPVSKAVTAGIIGNENIEVFSRRLIVTPEWQPVDFGWIKDPLAVFIENRAGYNTQVNPTEEEAKDLADQRILYAPECSTLPFFVPPRLGAFVFIQKVLFVKSATAENIVGRITVFPR